MFSNRSRGAVVALIIGASVAGCSHFDRLAPRKIEPLSATIYQNDPERLTERSELLSRVAPFVATPAVGAMKVNLILPPGSASAGAASDALPDYNITAANTVVTGSLSSANLTPDLYRTLLLDYRDDRRLQIDRLCDAYFAELDALAGNTDFGRASLNTAGDYLAVMMGLAGSPAKQLAVLAGSQAALNQTVDSARSLMLLSPAPATLRVLVDARQRKIIADANATASVTHASVEAQVRGYALACTPIGIRAIINEAVTDRTRAEDPEQTSVAGEALLADLQAALNAGRSADQRVVNLDETAAANLLWLADTPCPNDACEVAKRVKERYPAVVEAYLANKVAVRSKLDALVVAEPSIATRRGQIQNEFLTQQSTEALTKLSDEVATLRRQNAALTTRVNTLTQPAERQSNSATESQTPLPASQTPNSPAAPAAGPPGTTGPATTQADTEPDGPEDEDSPG